MHQSAKISRRRKLYGGFLCLVLLAGMTGIMNQWARRYETVCDDGFYGETLLSIGLIRPLITEEIKRFPVEADDSRCVFEDSFLEERTYGGERQHYGTDLMDAWNSRGALPVRSMTSGIVSKMGWNERGGWRVGITSSSGIYYYYAHLDSYARYLKEGDFVQPGQLLGYMGDSGYGEEGTVGQFAVHLHLGIQVYPASEDNGWVNPYPYLHQIR